MNRIGRPKKKKKDIAGPNDKINCNICPGYYTRSNKTKHNATQIHQICLKMDGDIGKILRNELIKEIHRDGFITVNELKYNAAVNRIKKKIELLNEVFIDEN